ncbi:serine/threonine-protein kinase [Glycomyces harbinensis]|uniref:Protein kinase domain-containing protein n=1 Tax=Glycomyces harbinensis TaxID=58114 RepID=A0A1G6QZ57_9ACTN|nr:serine/threonine-protein kinase [Glycomyces harbinensis]SDC97483.1 Protein kinase domain-containing protein [Glycomyces harbinensis]
MLTLTEDDPRAVGGHRLLARLGQAGTGQVYLAVDPEGRPIAVKRLPRDLAADPASRQRFALETAAARSVVGPRTVRVVDADIAAAEPWSATAFVPGPTLLHAIEAAGPLPEDFVRRIGAELASALGDVHAAELVHGDVQPSNVLLSPAGAVLTGTARTPDLSATEAFTRAGVGPASPGYMSPEEAESRGLTGSSDVFSLGCLLAAAASGRPPFAGASIPQQLYAVVHGEPDLAAVPESLRAPIAACLAKLPEDRPTPDGLRAILEQGGAADAEVPPIAATYAAKQEAAINALQAAALDRPETADPAPAFRPQAPATRRRRTPALIAAAAISALIAVVVLSIVFRPGTGEPEGVMAAEDAGSAPSAALEEPTAEPVVPAEICPLVDTDALLAMSPPGTTVGSVDERDNPDYGIETCTIHFSVDGELNWLDIWIQHRGVNDDIQVALCELGECGYSGLQRPFGESTERPWTEGALAERANGDLVMAWFTDHVGVTVGPFNAIDASSEAERDFLFDLGVAIYDILYEQG